VMGLQQDKILSPLTTGNAIFLIGMNTTVEQALEAMEKGYVHTLPPMGIIALMRNVAVVFTGDNCCRCGQVLNSKKLFFCYHNGAMFFNACTCSDVKAEAERP
jgi:hypothetical protein